MKKYLFLAFITFISAGVPFISPAIAQHKEQRGKIAELEKVKLIEVLNMDESTTVKFFARKQEFMRRAGDLSRQREDKMNQLQHAYEKGDRNDKFYREIIEGIQAADRDILKTKNEFVNSLPDILSYQQIAKYVVFERNFKREIKDLIIHKGMRKKD